MYERLLDKQAAPSFEDLLRYSGVGGALWTDLDEYLRETYSAEKIIRFPYGNKHGWSAKYSEKNGLICEVFAENGAFTVHFHISNEAMETVYRTLGDNAKTTWENKYPCTDGGWLHLRVVNEKQLKDLKHVLGAKMVEEAKRRGAALLLL